MRAAAVWGLRLPPCLCRRVRPCCSGTEVLRFCSPVTAKAPAPAAGEIRIRHRAIGVNFFDVYLRLGWMPALLPLPGVPGMEAAGSVLDVGEGVYDFFPGDRVACLSPVPGAYCSVRTVPVAQVVRLPAAIDDEVAAAMLLKGITADLLAHDLGRFRSGTRVLVHAAAGWCRSAGLLAGSQARRHRHRHRVDR